MSLSDWDCKRHRWARNAGTRIDHLLLSPVLAAGRRNANVHKNFRGKEGDSDHALTGWNLIGNPDK